MLSIARDYVRSYSIKMNEALGAEDIIDYIVSYDGTYQKRGFISKFGICFVIEWYTGLVIDFAVISKTCKKCNLKIIQLGADSNDFKQWYQSHVEKNECQKNIDGSSTAMETFAAEILWKRSIGVCNARYITMLSDGDAKTYELQVYGPDIEESAKKKKEGLTYQAGSF